MAIESGRMTAAYDGELVVFLIGMRINKLRAARQWWPVTVAMPKMLRQLQSDPDSGLLGFRMFPSLRNPLVVQYWSSVEKLQGFANDPGRLHRPAWIAYFRDSWQDGAVGVWHETYIVPPGHRETVYGNMPKIGLGKIAGVVPVSAGRDTAAERIAHGAAQRAGSEGNAEESAS